ncbi:transcription factor AP-1-like protein [Leptotrombidium deliense]|uniref:Transcription factor AP-1-like protein n=1 Tax=Leptotrombidium deliense TaxID=299467 RepID=A0A443ST70_9ACAR|nr:transcription factor AP-1-like protein [Leptotrombidium deliense]
MSMDNSIYDRNSCFMNNGEDIKSLKNSMKLDFGSSSGRKRNLPFSSNSHISDNRWTPSNCLLESPDLKMCKLATPEIEKMLLSNPTGLTPTPSLALPPSVTLASSDVGNYAQLKPAVTAEQEQYARGFEVALQKLHSQEDSNTCDRPMSNSSSSSTNGSLTQIDSRLSSTPSLPSFVSSQVSPINMEDQERIKLERKRLRNRIAASKCRRRKLEKIARLEDKVKQLKDTNNELNVNVRKLREQVCHLKEEVMLHVREGCQLSTATSHFH